MIIFSIVKIHQLDKKRIKGYQEENPERFGSIHITLSAGFQTSVSQNIKHGTLELSDDDQKEDVVFYLMNMDRSFRKLDHTEVKPIKRDRKLLVEVPFSDNTMYVYNVSVICATNCKCNFTY